MRRNAVIAVLVMLAAFAAEPAFAHHVMGGKTPETFMQGLLSGLGHPIIGLDHFAAVVAIGCLAAAHRAGAMLVPGYVIAMMLGVALHLQGATVPAAEILVALTVLGLGGVLLWQRQISAAAALALFALVGLIHGYALGESIFGAEKTPLAAYLLGLAIIQALIALGAMVIVRAAAKRADLVMPRLIGAGVAGVGLAILVQQIVPSV
jgi:urease accessory protein